MNRFEGSGTGVAKLKYLDNTFEVISPGSHVHCTVTGRVIPLDELKYWSHERQEPYADAAASLSRELEIRREQDN
jgi:hypothetical protein